jgi:protein-arginine deiminase
VGGSGGSVTATGAGGAGGESTGGGVGGESTASNTGGSSTGGAGGAGGMGGAGGGNTLCEPGATQECYSGPKGTLGVGACLGGVSECSADGSEWGPCEGEVTPVAETCASAGDEDCDGSANEEGAGCGCVPGSVAACYSGPSGTENVGPCKGGTQTCQPDGVGYGPCLGEVVPGLETCATAQDDDCDGLANEEGASCVCTPNTSASCYTGPAGTENVGACKSGSKTCNADGTAYGPCSGQVTPVNETCNTAGDDNCDGQVNEGGAGCVCLPGEMQACYSGAPGTQNVGICKSGTRTCNALGTGFGACSGEVLPGVEDCNTAADENCDGSSPPCAGNPPIIDLRADVNRNGAIDLADPTEDANEETWSKNQGAIFLANIDDDQKACSINATDAQLAACHDGADAVINGANDLADLARMKTVPWPQAPADAKATISLTAPGANNVRLYKNNGGTFAVFNPAADMLTSAELQAGVELAIEGKDIVRDSAVWNGYVKVTLNVDAGTGPNGPLPDGSDTVELRLAPVMFRHHLDEATKVYVSNVANNAGNAAMRADLLAATQAAGVPGGLTEFPVSDRWNQDYFETAYMSMPGPGGAQKVIHVNFRSANFTNNTLRSAGKVVYTILRGQDVAGATVYDPAHPNSMDTLNSFGNLETIPPYTKNGVPLTLGRVLRGSTPNFYPDQAFIKMITSQTVQNVLLIDTEWLLVGHVDETTSFIKAASPRGWVMLAADPTLAKTMLQQRQQAGFGNVQMFVGKQWSGGGSAAISINNVLGDPDVMNESAFAAVEIDGQLATIKAETGLTDAEIVKIPTLFEPASGYAVAYTPGTVNGIYLSDTDFGPPDPHGPVINGQDIFKVQMQNALQPYGVTVHFIEDWDAYHIQDGEVHCGSNTTRAIPANTKWWESGL